MWAQRPAVAVWMTADADELLFPPQPRPPPSALPYVPQPGIPRWKPPVGREPPPPPAPTEANAVSRAIETWGALAGQGGQWAAAIQAVIRMPDPELYYDLPRTETLLDLLHEDDPAPEAVREACEHQRRISNPDAGTGGAAGTTIPSRVPRPCMEAHPSLR